MGKLAWSIPEVVMIIRGKKQLKRALKIMDDHMSLIDEEITASNVRKFEKSSSMRAHFSNSTLINGTERRKQISLVREYQQCVDAVMTKKTRQFYTSCDV